MESKQNIINEYLEVSIKQNLVQICRDCYQSLGWTITNTRTGIGIVTLKMQRNKKIKNRIELCNLQHICEDAFNTIEKLENSRSKKAKAVYLWVKIAGTILLTGSILAYQAALMLVFIMLLTLGFLGCFLLLFLCKKFIKESRDTGKAMIEKNLLVIHEACEKASLLL